MLTASQMWSPVFHRMKMKRRVRKMYMPKVCRTVAPIEVVCLPVLSAPEASAV